MLTTCIGSRYGNLRRLGNRESLSQYEIIAILLKPRRRRLSVIATFRFSIVFQSCQDCEERAPLGLALTALEDDTTCGVNNLERMG